jgi:hypothetical protein
VIQSEESLPEEGDAALLPWSLKSLGRAVGYEYSGVMEKVEMMTGCWNDILIHWSVTALEAIDPAVFQNEVALPSNALLAEYELASLLAVHEAGPGVHGVAIRPPLASKNFSSATEM